MNWEDALLEALCIIILALFAGVLAYIGGWLLEHGDGGAKALGAFIATIVIAIGAVICKWISNLLPKKE